MRKKFPFFKYSLVCVWSNGYLDADHEPYSSFTNKILKLKKSPPTPSWALKWRAAFCSVLTEAGWCNALRLHQMSYWDRSTASIARALKQALHPVQGFEEAITKRSKRTTAFIQRSLESKRIKEHVPVGKCGSHVKEAKYSIVLWSVVFSRGMLEIFSVCGCFRWGRRWPPRRDWAFGWCRCGFRTRELRWEPPARDELDFVSAYNSLVPSQSPANKSPQLCVLNLSLHSKKKKGPRSCKSRSLLH